MVDPRRTIRDENSLPEAPREWLVENGLGGYASATITGEITRRYHGFLIAAQPAPIGRMVVLNDLEVDVELEDNSVVNLRENGRFVDFTLNMGLPSWRYELEDELRLKDIDLVTGRLYVRRKKGSSSAHHPVEGDELRALRAWLRVRDQCSDAGFPYLFMSERGPMTRQAINYLVAQTAERAGLRFHIHPHMLRHSTGYHLANRIGDTRLLQEYLGHRNIAHTTRYTRAAPIDFQGLWR